MSTKSENTMDFSERLAIIRKSRAMTQLELSKKSGISRRMIAYYEREGSNPPPGSLLPALANALKVTTDALLGLEPLKVKADTKSVRLMNRLKRVEELPSADQRAVLKFVDALVVTRGRGNGSKTDRKG